jgi:photosystem II stability/assembly factor-like uncharacterized protein
MRYALHPYGLYGLLGLFLAGCRLMGGGNVPAWTNPGWVVQPVGTTQRFQAISIVDARTVWVSGTGGTYARTSDGGATWVAGVVPGADTLEFRDLHAADARTAWLLSAGTGSASRIYKTTDAGNTWVRVFTNDEPRGFFDCMDFWDAQRGVAFSDAVDGRFGLITTRDGGNTWQRVASDAVPPALPGEGAFAASGTCVVTRPGGFGWVGTGASGIRARVLQTTDYGQTWAVADAPLVSNSTTSGIFSLVFRDARHGWALGGDFGKPTERSQNVARTDDGGRTWALVGSTNLGGAVFGAAWIPGTDALVAVSPGGSDLSTDGGTTWARLDTLNYWSVAFLDQQTGWAVGPNGRIARFTPHP